MSFLNRYPELTVSRRTENYGEEKNFFVFIFSLFNALKNLTARLNKNVNTNITLKVLPVFLPTPIATVISATLNMYTEISM